MDNKKINETGRQLILIVDDDRVNIYILENILKENGYKTSSASNGREALAIIEKTLPDLILLDIMMPEMSGFEVCKILKNSPEASGIPIIFLTVKTETDDIVKGFRLGGVDYVTRPYNPSVLLARVRTHLELKKARQTQEEMILELQNALAQVKHLSGLLPICSSCKKIRDDRGYWNQIELYISEHSEADFSHGICPECVRKIYPEFQLDD